MVNIFAFHLRNISDHDEETKCSEALDPTRGGTNWSWASPFVYTSHGPFCRLKYSNVVCEPSTGLNGIQFVKVARMGSLIPKEIITKRLYNFDPSKPHFYTVKLGFTGVYIIFRFLLKNIDCGYAFEPPHRGGFNEFPQSMF